MRRVIFGPQAPTREILALGCVTRLVFAAVLLRFFWTSALTKLDGFGLSASAYVQIFPRRMEALGYDPDGLAPLAKLVVAAGTAAEIILPALILAGLATRAASVMMIGFIIVMTVTDLVGHGVGPETAGKLFDRAADSLLDQRLLWIWLLGGLAVSGGGWFSADRLFNGLRRHTPR
ncbi:DoxX family membrane protein [Thioclava sp. GXIMD2076]|uniref:DoxX family protein n=1 Tax=Thioclava sp. GXIMD2076 TaxID=3131931 RepID=UPI0030CF86A8